MTSNPAGGTTRLIQDRIADLRAGGNAQVEAINRLVDVAFGRLERLARRMLRDYPKLRDETGDLLSAAYQRLARALNDPQVLERLRTAGDFFNLAATQIRRELIDLARRSARFKEQVGFGSPAADDSSVAAPILPVDVTQSPDRLALWTEFHERVEQLPASEREVFTHVWYHDLPYVETATLLDCDERTVRRRYQSARKLLLELLGGRLPF